MILYHGSRNIISIGDSLKTPTGISQMDVMSGGIIYLTDSIDKCRRYGIVYKVEVTSAILYSEQRKIQGLPKKKSRYTSGVWVSLPENTRIKEVV